jgi:hypothetical protein
MNAKKNPVSPNKKPTPIPEQYKSFAEPITDKEQEEQGMSKSVRLNRAIELYNLLKIFRENNMRYVIPLETFKQEWTDSTDHRDYIKQLKYIRVAVDQKFKEKVNYHVGLDVKDPKKEIVKFWLSSKRDTNKPASV